MLCNWVIEKMPTMVKLVGGMNAVEATLFAVGLMFSFYWLYVLFYNMFLIVRVNVQGMPKTKRVERFKGHKTQKSKRAVKRVAVKRSYFDDDEKFDASWMGYEAWRATR